MHSIVAIAVAAFMLAIAMWTVVPSPTLLALGFTLFAAELAWQCLIGVALIGSGCIALASGDARLVVIALVVLSLLALARVLVRVPGTWSRADAALRAVGAVPVSVSQRYAVNVTFDLPVALRDGSASSLDLYRPGVPGPLPFIVTVHGGAWNSGSKTNEAPLARWYAARGYAVVCVEYRLTPAHQFPVELNDVEDALQTIATHAGEWNLDADRVALLGRSAGGQLVLLAAERAQPLNVRAVIAYYAPTDLAAGWETPPRPDPAHVRPILEAYLGGPPDAEHLPAYRAASPLHGAHAGMPPVLALVGSRDALVLPKFQRAFAVRLNEIGVKNAAIELPWANHAFDALNGLGSALGKDATLRFLRAFLR